MAAQERTVHGPSPRSQGGSGRTIWGIRGKRKGVGWCRREVLGRVALVSSPSPLLPARQRAHAMVASGDHAGARAVLERAVELGKVNLSKDDPDLLRTAYELGGLLQRSDDPAGARRVLEEAYAGGIWRLGDLDPLMLEISAGIGIAAAELGNRHEARIAFARVAEHGPGVLGVDHWAVARARAYLGQDQNPSPVRPEAPPQPQSVPPRLIQPQTVAPQAPARTREPHAPSSHAFAPQFPPAAPEPRIHAPHTSTTAIGSQAFVPQSPTVPSDAQVLVPHAPAATPEPQAFAPQSPTEPSDAQALAPHIPAATPEPQAFAPQLTAATSEPHTFARHAGTAASGPPAPTASDTVAGNDGEADTALLPAVRELGGGGVADAQTVEFPVLPVAEQLRADEEALGGPTAAFRVVRPSTVEPPSPGNLHVWVPPPRVGDEAKAKRGVRGTGSDGKAHRRGVGRFALLAALLAAVITVAALIIVLAHRSDDSDAGSNVPNLGGTPVGDLHLRDSGVEIGLSGRSAANGASPRGGRTRFSGPCHGGTWDYRSCGRWVELSRVSPGRVRRPGPALV